MTTDRTFTTSDKLLEALLAVGIEHVFANLGTDHVPIIEALARRREQGKPCPNFVLCPHENIAVHMALGYASATGQGQAVMVHVDAGTANAAMGVANAARTRVPVLLMAGKAPYDVQGVLPGGRDNYVHFVQDPFDIGSLVRPYLKWEYVLMSDANVQEVTRRAHSVMHNEPAGPAFMVMPREVLAAPAAHAEAEFSAQRFGSTQMGGLSADQVQTMAEQLFKAEDPVLVTSYLGRKPQAAQALAAFCECFGVRVVEANPTHLNIDRSSAWAAGFDAGRYIGTADLVLLVDTDVPWLPKFAKPKAGASCIQIDIDANKSDFPMWGFGAELRVQADTLAALQALTAYGLAHASAAQRAAVAQRKAACMASKSNAQAAAPAASAATGVPLKPVLQELQRLLSPRDVVVNEAIRNAPLVMNELLRTEAGTYFSNAGGGLGASSGWALGLKMACPDRRVVQVVGDGSFHFCTPTSFFAVARNQRLPVLTIVLNNGGWQAVKEAVLRMYPDGDAFQANTFQANLESTQTRFGLVAEAFGAKGLEIRALDQAPAVLAEALRLLDAGSSVLVDVKLAPIE
jgi:acetolactate synthase-1/2/3 large subunit